MEWISVQERLPEEEGEYLVWRVWAGIAQRSLIWFREGEWFYGPPELGLGSIAEHGDQVTHWMPLPSPPTDSQ